MDPTYEVLSASSSTGFTFDAGSLTLTASGTIDYKDGSGDGYNGDVSFSLCVDDVCADFMLDYSNCRTPQVVEWG